MFCSIFLILKVVIGPVTLISVFTNFQIRQLKILTCSLNLFQNIRFNINRVMWRKARTSNYNFNHLILHSSFEKHKNRGMSKIQGTKFQLISLSDAHLFLLRKTYITYWSRMSLPFSFTIYCPTSIYEEIFVPEFEKKFWFVELLSVSFFFFLFFSMWVFFHELSRITGLQGKGEGYFINSSLQLPPASQTLRH